MPVSIPPTISPMKMNSGFNLRMPGLYPPPEPSRPCGHTGRMSEPASNPTSARRRWLLAGLAVAVTVAFLAVVLDAIMIDAQQARSKVARTKRQIMLDGHEQPLSENPGLD